MRILVTGSRTWNDEETIENALWVYAYPYTLKPRGKDAPILVSGGCPTGADSMAEHYWNTLHLPIERHPAKWDVYGKKAGFVRNALMVAKGADVCLAFIRNNSKGATMTATLAIEAGIYTEIFR